MDKKGYYRHKKQLKKDVIPVDNITKFGYEPEDFEDVEEFVEYSGEEIAKQEYEKAKKGLEETDYIALKAIEELLSCSDIASLFSVLADFKNKYADILKQRKQWREKINKKEELKWKNNIS